MNEIYFDNSATTMCCEAAAKAAYAVMCEQYGNPSSLHRKGMEAEALLRTARQTIAKTFGAAEEEIFFTSGGTESDNLAIRGAAYANRRHGKHIITSAIEHPAVLNTCKALTGYGFELSIIGVDACGVLNLNEFEQSLRDDTILVSLMHVNNETGAVQPIERVAALLSEQAPKALLHVDAVQSYGKLSMKKLAKQADLISVSSHKIHGPKGVGALYVKRGVRLQPIMTGGGQERDLRSGTENMPGIVGFGVAAQLACSDVEANVAQMAAVKQRFIDELYDLPDWQINGAPEQCVPAVLNISFGGCKSEVLLHYFEDAGLYVSSGSACSSHSGKLSHVLSAMKLPDAAIDSAIRFSFSRYNTEEQAVAAADIVKKSVTELRKILGGMR